METSCTESDSDDVVMLPISSRRKRKNVIFSSDDDFEPEVPIKKRKKAQNLKTKNTSSTSSSTTARDSFQRNPLDQTTIHPESYHIAKRIIEGLKLTLEHIGCDELRSTCTSLLKSESELESYCTNVTGLETVRYIVETLSRPLDFDIRQHHFGPLFRDCLRSAADLHANMPVIGRVINVTTFGAFVDIGVEVSGFIHVSQFPRPNNTTTANSRITNYREETLKLGDVIRASIEAIKDKGKVSLKQIALVNDPSEINDLITSTSSTSMTKSNVMNTNSNPQSVDKKPPHHQSYQSSYNNKPVIKSEPHHQSYQSSYNNKPVIKSEPGCSSSSNNKVTQQHTTALIDLIIGDKVTGVVMNIVDYAAFVNIASECNAFAHITQLPKLRNGTPGDERHGPLKVGDSVEALIDDVKVDTRKIKLRNLKIL